MSGNVRSLRRTVNRACRSRFRYARFSGSTIKSYACASTILSALSCRNSIEASELPVYYSAASSASAGRQRGLVSFKQAVLFEARRALLALSPFSLFEAKPQVELAALPRGERRGRGGKRSLTEWRGRTSEARSHGRSDCSCWGEGRDAPFPYGT